MRQVVKQNAGWVLAANISLIPIPFLVFITDGFVTKNMGPGGSFLFFVYLTHIKDCVVVGLAVDKIIRASKAIKAREISPQSPFADYGVLNGDEEYEPIPESYEITEVPESKRTKVRVLAFHLLITATALYFILVLPSMPEPETLLEKAHTALVLLNHSWDTTIFGAESLRYNFPLRTSGTKCQRIWNEYGLPLSVLASYALFLYGFQALGLTDENGDPPYKAVNFKEAPESAAILCGALALGMPIVNKLLLKCLEAIQYCFHSPAGSVKNQVRAFGSGAGNCLVGVGRSVYNFGSNLYSVFTCNPCRRASPSSSPEMKFGRSPELRG